MAIQPFTISVTVATTPSEKLDEIAQVFATNYGDLGDDESLSDYLSRHLEQYLLGIYSNSLVNASMQSSGNQAKIEVAAAATIKKRKDKPKVEADTETTE